MLLISGHLGFIGSHLTKLLDEKNISWVGYDLIDGKDIRNTMQLDKFFEENQITQVIHLAALAGVRRGNEYPDDYISTNIKGTWNLVKMSEKYNVKRFINFSSSSVYGEGKPPISEIDEKNPISLYGITKLAGEKILASSSIRDKITVIPFTVYGENGRRDEVVYRWLEQYKNNKPITLYGDGSSCRGYVYVKDLVEAVTKLIIDNKFENANLTLNIGGCEQVTLKDLFNVFNDIIPNINFVKLEMPKTDIKINYANTALAREILGFNPKPQFEKVVKKIIRKELKSYGNK